MTPTSSPVAVPGHVTPTTWPRRMRSRTTGLTLVVLVATGALLRLWHLGDSRLGYDESFTAMAGRRSFGSMLGYLTAHDSHPPLDYLLHLPLARAGVSELWFRMPSALCSIGALALLAWWLRDRPWLAVTATAVLAVAPFELAHGRTARMYAELEILGVAVAYLTACWLRRPRRAHAVGLAALVTLGLLTHVSTFLLVAGLLVVAGLRRDRAAWQWRGALVTALAVWAVAWGPEFLVQARGGHSTWIPRTTPTTLATAVGNALSPQHALIAVAVVACGIAVMIRRRDPLTRVVVGLAVVPVAVGATAGLVFPVTLDRTFTLMAWAPAVAVGLLVEAAATRRWRIPAIALGTAVVALVATGAPAVVDGHTGPDVPLRLMAEHARAGDVIAVRPAYKAPELQWSLGVRAHPDSDHVRLPGRRAYALRLGDRPLSGRLWLLDWHRYGSPGRWGTASCHRTVAWHATSIRCIDLTHATELELTPHRDGHRVAAGQR